MKVINPFWADVPITISLRATASSLESSSITIPSTVEDGDYAVLFDLAGSYSGSPPSAVYPTGWSTEIQYAGDHSRIIISSKALSSSDASASVSGMSSNARSKIMIVFSGTKSLENATCNSHYAYIHDNSLYRSVNTSNDPVIPSYAVIGVIGSADWIPSWDQFDEQYGSADCEDGEVEAYNTSGGLGLKYKIYDPGDTQYDDITIAVADAGSENCLAGVLLSPTGEYGHI